MRHYYLSRLFIPVVLLLTFPSLADTTVKSQTIQATYFVTASGVRVRAAPNTASAEKARLNLGDQVTAIQRTHEKLPVDSTSAYWYALKQPQGWVAGNYLVEAPVGQEEQLWLQLAKQRLQKTGISFLDQADLYRFIDKTIPNIKNTAIKAEMELLRLLALQETLNTISSNSIMNDSRRSDKAYTDWLAQYRKSFDLFDDEISGRWLIPVKYYWHLADKYAKTQAGDELAWQASQASLGGECEGDISCNLHRESLTRGEYLRRFPAGKYVNQSLIELKEVLDFIHSELKSQPNYFKDAKDTLKPIQALIKSLNRVSSQAPKQAKVLKSLKSLETAVKKA
ncbi:SH3 domain-containing protein [Thiolinea disciformis]|uniref:SH3 domain-containing protein n=1 Tax=Thiolinea disciformis TaxID=125614 RepID=UPI000372AA32|nr:SH3 domain-containing protein [Thiolinea disciformis]